MAVVSITLKISLDEANLIMKLLDEGEAWRNDKGRLISEQDRVLVNQAGNKVANPEWQRMGQEVLQIQGIRRGIQGANR